MKTMASLVAVVLFSPILAAPAWEDEFDFSAEMIKRSIADAVERSPDDYVAALIEVVGFPQCAEHGEGDCWQRVRIVRLFASKKDGRRWNHDFDRYGQGSIGTRSIIFAIPMEPDPTVYGCTLGIAVTTQKVQNKFAQVVHSLGL